MEQYFVLLIIIFIVSLSLTMYVEGFTSEVGFVTSPHDQRSYLVRNLPDKEKAARLLSILRARLLKLVDILAQKYPHDRRIYRLKTNFNPDEISESTPDSKYTSYSVNKGEKIVFCIRQRNAKNELVDINTMMFVGIHELSHLMTVSVGHTREFWENMKFLLGEALSKDIQLYNYQPFHEEPVEYCGVKVSDTPLKL